MKQAEFVFRSSINYLAPRSAKGAFGNLWVHSRDPYALQWCISDKNTYSLLSSFFVEIDKIQKKTSTCAMAGKSGISTAY
jgi:hypothetical protein